MRFGSVCWAWVFLDRENTVDARRKKSPGRASSLGCSGGRCCSAGGGPGLQTCGAIRAGAITCACTCACATSGCGAVAVAVSGAEEGSAGWSSGLAGAPGNSRLPKACLDGCARWSWTAAEALETAGRARGRYCRYFAETKRLVCAGACTASTFSWSAASIPVRLRDLPSFSFPSLFVLPPTAHLCKSDQSAHGDPREAAKHTLPETCRA